MKFGLRLKELRLQNKLTQQELGELVHVSKVSISGYERGDRSPDRDTLTALADYFGVSIDYLLGRDHSTDFLSEKQRTVAQQIDETFTSEEMTSILDYISFVKQRHTTKEKKHS